ncbi:sigma-70 family RNA polymerase sigma factor [Bacillus sp. MUM 116]|uniref:sigma-70 family RNA polymerase sigma factor n=1 Tax=Bacillus sp. MUM 116 TaxID=1678002 RepID=UPI003529AE4B
MNDLYRYLYSLSKDHYIAEDLVQEAFYRAFTTLEDYEVRNIKAWLFKVAYHAFVDYKRKNKRMIIDHYLTLDTDINPITPEKKMLEKESLSLLLRDLNGLKEKEKDAINAGLLLKTVEIADFFVYRLPIIGLVLGVRFNIQR